MTPRMKLLMSLIYPTLLEIGMRTEMVPVTGPTSQSSRRDPLQVSVIKTILQLTRSRSYPKYNQFQYHEPTINKLMVAMIHHKLLRSRRLGNKMKFLPKLLQFRFNR